MPLPSSSPRRQQLSPGAINEAMRSARSWRQRSRRPSARGRTPAIMDDRVFKQAFLHSLVIAAVKRNSRCRRERAHRPVDPRAIMPLTRCDFDRIVQQTQERAFVREIRSYALACGPLPRCRPAASMVRDGDLNMELSDPASAAALFAKTGICAFENVLPPELIDACRASFENTFEASIQPALAAKGFGADGAYLGSEIAFNEVCLRGRERLDIRQVGMAEASMTDHRLHASAPWMQFIRAVLGEGAHECFRGVVANRPGSGMQEWHADGVHEYYQASREAGSEANDEGQHASSTVTPTVAEWHARSEANVVTREERTQRLTCFIPLVDLKDVECGATQFFPGSHMHATANLYRRLSPELAGHESQPVSCSPRPGAGGLIFFDYRLVHRGTPNTRPRGAATRPILYIVYAGRGYDDVHNFPTYRPLFSDTAVS